MKIPYIASEYKPLFRPEKYGNYVNDHCIIRKDGEYHLFGITSQTSHPYDERYFVHAVGEKLDGTMQEVGKSIDRGTLAWSPCIVEKENDFYMFYGPSPSSLAVSPDLFEWFGYPLKIEDEPVYAMHRDHFVLRKDDGEYIMYVTGIKDRGGCISVATSKNLLHWQFAGYALTSGEAAPLKPAWGAFESPYVVHKDGIYYLFVTYTDCSDENYNDTLVFASKDPLNFGCYMGKENPAVPITTLYAHAPEILEADGKTYITTCGWRSKPNPNTGCVSIAELGWKEEKEA